MCRLEKIKLKKQGDAVRDRFRRWRFEGLRYNLLNMKQKRLNSRELGGGIIQGGRKPGKGEPCGMLIALPRVDYLFQKSEKNTPFKNVGVDGDDLLEKA